MAAKSLCGEHVETVPLIAEHGGCPAANVARQRIHEVRRTKDRVRHSTGRYCVFGTPLRTQRGGPRVGSCEHVRDVAEARSRRTTGAPSWPPPPITRTVAVTREPLRERPRP